MRRLRAVLFAGLLALIAVSCRTSKVATESEGEASDRLSLNERFENVVSSQGEWTRIQAPVKVSLLKPEKFSLSGRVYMVRGENIHFSMRFIGLEVAVIDVTRDSVFVIDKYHRKYLAEPIGALLAGAEVSISDIQDILLGRAFINGDGALSKGALKNVILKKDGDSWSITPKKKIHGVEYSFIYNVADDVMNRLIVTAGKRKVEAKYDSPIETSSGRFMQTLGIETAAGSKPIAVKIATTMKSAKWTFKDNVLTHDTEGYERIGVKQILKLFK